jgi:hypothetical protein
MRLALLLIILTLAYGAQAEYGTWIFRGDLEMKDGSHREVYVELTQGYLNEDSLDQPGYIPQHMRYQNGDANDTLRFFARLAAYHYNISDENSITSYVLLDPVDVLATDVRGFRILERKDYNYMTSTTFLGPTDELSWINDPVLREVHVGGFFCSYSIYVHRRLEEVVQIMDLLDEMDRKMTDRVEQLENEMQTESSDYRAALSDQIDDIYERADDAFHQVISALPPSYVVIVSVCSC